jgi:hypothetical protein
VVNQQLLCAPNNGLKVLRTVYVPSYLGWVLP